MTNQLKVNRHQPERFAIVLLLGALSAITLPSCSQEYSTSLSSYQREMKPAAAPAPKQAMDNMVSQSETKIASNEETAIASAQAPRTLPQLIKKAELTLVVGSIDKSMQQVSALVKKQQGDILGFQESQPTDPSSRQTASMQLRIPSQKLDATLDALAKLGSVESRSLTAEDVSDQLVDFQARLKNLRKSEEALLKIMERSGTVRDVLQVSQQLSNTRESIERISAQLKSLQNQVAYSTINLNLQAAVSAAPVSVTPVGLRVQESWGKATHSVSEFTMGLLSLTIWLFAFSPYFFFIGAIVYGIYRYHKSKSQLVSK